MEGKVSTEPVGNADLAWRDKTAFLCSSAVPGRVLEASLRWVDGLSAESDCVMCGNLQMVEREVLARLLSLKIPTILVLSKPFPPMWPIDIVRAIGKRLLLVVTTVDFELPWVDKYDEAQSRNKYMLSQASKVVVGYCTPGGKLSAQLSGREGVSLLTECLPEDAAEIAQRRARRG